MSTLTSEVLLRALVRELPAACTAAFGGTAAPAEAASAPAAGDGVAVTVPLAGASSGRVMVWLDRASAIACASRRAADGAEPGDEAIGSALTALGTAVASTLEGAPEAAGLSIGAPTVAPAPAPEQGASAAVAFDDGTSIQVRVNASLTAVAAQASASEPSADSRLEAVLEVDLPLVVRFGRAVMPLRAVAELSPGAVVDMGRTPDEPVELLVGERLVARGEVVIVGGNYGVRITEITSGRRSSDQEART